MKILNRSLLIISVLAIAGCTKVIPIETPTDNESDQPIALEQQENLSGEENPTKKYILSLNESPTPNENETYYMFLERLGVNMPLSAYGVEPFRDISISGDLLTFNSPEQEEKIPVTVKYVFENNEMLYNFSGDRIEGTFENKGCRDQSVGGYHHYTVKFTHNGINYEGCGDRKPIVPILENMEGSDRDLFLSLNEENEGEFGKRAENYRNIQHHVYDYFLEETNTNGEEIMQSLTTEPITYPWNDCPKKALGSVLVTGYLESKLEPFCTECDEEALGNAPLEEVRTLRIDNPEGGACYMDNPMFQKLYLGKVDGNTLYSSTNYEGTRFSRTYEISGVNGISNGNIMNYLDDGLPHQFRVVLYWSDFNRISAEDSNVLDFEVIE